MPAQKKLIVGKISGVFGVKGWIKVFSYTEPKENILAYSPWVLSKGQESGIIKVLDGQIQGKSVVAQVEAVNNRDDALLLVGCDILINQEQLPPPSQGEYYWTDLIGLEVENLEGISLGKVVRLFETGANDILVIKGDKERALPFLQGETVKAIDLDTGKMLVDWDADF